MFCVLIGCYAERRRLCPSPDWLPRGGGFRGGVSGVGSHGSARQGDRGREEGAGMLRLTTLAREGGDPEGGLRVEEGDNLQGR